MVLLTKLLFCEHRWVLHQIIHSLPHFLWKRRASVAAFKTRRQLAISPSRLYFLGDLILVVCFWEEYVPSLLAQSPPFHSFVDNRLTKKVSFWATRKCCSTDLLSLTSPLDVQGRSSVICVHILYFYIRKILRCSGHESGLMSLVIGSGYKLFEFAVNANTTCSSHPKSLQ